MVSAGQPQRIVALHTAGTDNDVVQRIVECMTEVQRAGNVGRRITIENIGPGRLGSALK